MSTLNTTNKTATTANDAYTKLEKYFRRLSHLSHFSSIAQWDRAVNMPSGSSENRGEAMAELKVIMIELMKNPELCTLLLKCEEQKSSLSDWQQANVREMKRGWLQANAVSEDIIEQKSIAGVRCESGWRRFRAENNWKDFLPLFEEVVKFTREEAAQRAEATGLSLYESLLDQYEPGMRCQQLDKTFEELKSFLPDLVNQIREKQKDDELQFPIGPFKKENQRKLGLELMDILGFDFTRGRLDVSHHPFCGGVPQDVRITTRYDENEFLEGIMSVIHETGHASYEQGLPTEWAAQPVGTARGMGIHEGQSLFFEMQVAKSREFLTFVAPLMRKHLSNGDDGAYTPENLFKLNSRVEQTYIRVTADEVTYPLHVILRYEIERDLIEGKIEAKDLPEIWDQKMTAYLGLSTKDNYKNGCMQDIHWTDGAFGYFPSYTLGAMNAAQIFNSAHASLPHLLSDLKVGNLDALLSFLREKIWSQASFHSTNDLMTYATGESLNPKYFKEHLKNRYLG